MSIRKLACGFVFSFAAFAAASVFAGSASFYVQDGLVACWDGIENAGSGIHDSAATAWKDLVAGREFALTGVTVNDDRMTFAGTMSGSPSRIDSYGTLSAADTTSTFVAAKNGTMEIVYRSSSSAASQVFLQAPGTSGIAFGIWNTSSILNFSSAATTVNKSAFTFTSGTATNSVSVRYSSSAPVSATANGSALPQSSSASYWSYPSTETQTYVHLAGGTHRPSGHGYDPGPDELPHFHHLLRFRAVRDLLAGGCRPGHARPGARRKFPEPDGHP